MKAGLLTYWWNAFTGAGDHSVTVPPWALVAIDSTAGRLPVAPGVKPMVSVQDDPAAMTPVQVLPVSR